jgi:hypothetical protein
VGRQVWSPAWWRSRPEIDKPTLAWTQAVVDRWEIACRKYLNVPGWQARFLAPGFPSPFAVLREAASAAR